jgi:hypothetical protein
MYKQFYAEIITTPSAERCEIVLFLMLFLRFYKFSSGDLGIVKFRWEFGVGFVSFPIRIYQILTNVCDRTRLSVFPYPV